MQVVASITGDLRTILEDAQNSLADALRLGTEIASKHLQNDLRGQVADAGLGMGLEKAWRLQMYPTGRRTLRPAGLVYSKATALHRAFENGAVIRAEKARFLAIPMPAAEQMGFATTAISRKGGAVPGNQLRRASRVYALIAKLGAQNIRIVKLSNGRRMIVWVRGGSARKRTFRGRGTAQTVSAGQGVALFLLVPQVTITPRLDIAGAEVRAASDLNVQIENAVEETL